MHYDKVVNNLNRVPTNVREGDTMGTIIALIFVWFVVSVPVSLMVGAYFASSHQTVSQTTSYPGMMSESVELEAISVS